MDGTKLTRYTFDDDGRIYTDEDEMWLPSVSTVLDVRPKPPALKKYLSSTSEADKNQKTFYTQNRGTLIHYELLSQLVEEDFWSDDEQSSQECLKGTREHETTGITGGYETWSRYQEDLEWARETWDTMRSIYDIHPESTLKVELFVKNEAVGYAGQFDLLSVDQDTGEVILRDIKTSKRVYDKHLIQLEAYAHAVNIQVDRLEVLRLNPDGKTWEVSRSDEWVEDRSELWAEFKDLRSQLADEKIDGLRNRVQSDDE